MTVMTHEDRQHRTHAALNRIQALNDIDRRAVLAYLCGWATEDVEHTLDLLFGDRAGNHR